MPIIVQKFGGSSLSDLSKIQRVAATIIEEKKSGKDLVIVVSAMGDTTDELLKLAHQMSSSPSRRELDMLLSAGERISMALLSMAIVDAGFEAISLTGSQCGIITTDSHSNARVVDVRPFRVQDELEKGKIVIVAGYQGTSYRREVTTLGRGGSDTTAVALAAALNAEACEIFSDVDGIYSADPRIVVDAERLDSISYEEMLELAKSGARVLNAQAVAFAQNRQIALYAKKTALKGEGGTVIRPDGAYERVNAVENGCGVAGISHIKNGLLVEGEIKDALDAFDLSFLNYAEIHTTAFVNLDDIHHQEELRIELESKDLQVRNAGLISVVGLNIGSTPKWVRYGTQKLVAKPLSIFTGSNRISWVLPSSSVHENTEILHTFFVKDHGISAL